jgi:ubiquinone/menaquinone biosynthesis C-methylase UbiE
MTDPERQWYESRRVHGDKTTLLYKVGRALRSPHRLGIYLRRYVNSKRFGLRARNQEDLFRMYVDDLASRNSYGAVGPTNDRSDWERIGKLQFDYLVKHGLKPEHRLLDIGCGNLRGGHHIIRHLDCGHYAGIDISREILLSALSVIEEYFLQEKMAYIYIVRDMNFSFLPDNYFDRVHAHSVFSHCELEAIERCLGGVKRVLKRDGLFDFTILESTDKNYNLFREDYYYPRATMIDTATKIGFTAEVMEDWDYIQTKIRLRHAEPKDVGVPRLDG